MLHRHLLDLNEYTPANLFISCVSFSEDNTLAIVYDISSQMYHPMYV